MKPISNLTVCFISFNLMKVQCPFTWQNSSRQTCQDQLEDFVTRKKLTIMQCKEGDPLFAVIH